MPSLTFPTGARRVHIEFPEHLQPTTSAPSSPETRNSRNLPPPAAEPEADALRSALAAAGVELIARSTFVPSISPRGDTRAAPATAGGELLQATVELADDDEAAAVLTIEDGYYSWHLENTTLRQPPIRTRDPSLATGPRVVRVPLLLGTAAPTARLRTRGAITDFVVSQVQVLVFKFAGRHLLRRFGAKNEESVHYALRALRGEAPILDWPVVVPGTRAPLAARPVRVLLFVHGTFSSTLGGFGELAATVEGRGFFSAARARYDSVLAFDHPTLSVTPLDNAHELLARLRDFLGDREAEIDVICHSRGGLVIRSLVELILPTAELSWTCPRIVFVGAANGGTLLAEPGNWHHLVEFYTNLAAGAGRLLARVPSVSTAVAGTLVTELTRGVGLLVKVLASEAIDQGVLPGLAAMQPSGDFIKALNATQPGQPAPADIAYYAITADFSAKFARQPGTNTGLPTRLLFLAADRVVDRHMGEANDLVVNVGAMTAIDPHAGTFIKDTLAFENSAVVYHTNYFQQPAVVERLTEWLLASSSAGTDDSPAIALTSPKHAAAAVPATPSPDKTAPTVRSPAAPRVLEDRSGNFGSLKSRVDIPSPRVGETVAPPLAAKPPIPAPDAAAPEIEAQEADASTVACHLRAEVDGTLLLGRRATVDVTLSREALGAALRSMHSDASGVIDPHAEITVEILPRRNVIILGETRVDTKPPAPGMPLIRHFDIHPTHSGSGEVVVRARQGSLPFATVNLSFTIASSAEDLEATVAVRASGTALAAMPPPIVQPDHQLTILESERGGRRFYQYIFDSPVLGRNDRFESPEIIGDVLTYTRELHHDIEKAWERCGDDFANLQEDLREIGATLWDELIPDGLKSLLWAHRDEIKEILVFAEEPFVPWELVHLKPPGGPLPFDEVRFLGQLGLVRCFHGCGWPVATLHARPGRCHLLQPNYSSPGWDLPETRAEADFLRAKFQTSTIEPNLRAVRDLFNSATGFDLLHIAAHGQADTADIGRACILLEGLGSAGTPAEAFRTNLVRHAPRLDRGSDHAAPIVVLNACQAGRTGRGLTGFDGFAPVFMRQGAGAFVAAAWAVGDRPARSFVEAFYERLLAGDTLAAATTAARETARAAGDATWLAYTVYGNPLARLESAVPTPPDA